MLLLLLAFLADPGAALSVARERISAGDCAGAVQVLEPAVIDAESIEDPNERAAAAGAVHFYAALALSECGRSDDAEEHLREFLRFRPELTTIDATKYPRRFVALFQDVQRSVQSVILFDGAYPGFDRYAEIESDEGLSLALWGTNAGFQILAEPQEREEWGRLRSDEERQLFIERFWSRREGTRSQRYRDVIARRVAFADTAFSSPEEVRGALTDRGRVFVLLGPPARVYRAGIKRHETTIVQQRARTPLTGMLERWVYFNWQLPAGIAAKEVEFRFITQPGYGEGVMQKDFWPLKALAEARRIPGAGAE